MSGRVRWVGAGVLVVLVAGCTGTGPVEYRPGSVHQDPQGAYAIVLPQGWAQDFGYPYRTPDDEERGEPARDVAFVEESVLDEPERERRDARRITVDVDVWGGSLEEVVDQRRSGAVEVGAQLTVDEPVVLPDGTPAHLLGESFDAGGYEHRVLYLLNGGTLIAVEARSTGDDRDRYRALYDAVQRSVTTPVDAPRPTAAELSGHQVQPGVPFRDDRGAFTVAPPAGWEILAGPPKVDGDRSVFFFDTDRDAPGAPRSRSTIYISVTTPGDGISLADRVEQERADFFASQYTRDEPVVLPDGTPAHLFVAEGHRRLLLLAVGRDELYEVEASAETEPDWVRNRAVIDDAVASFSLT